MTAAGRPPSRAASPAWRYPGDTIEIVTDTTIAESPTIAKSLTLDSGTGFAGSISGHVQVTGNTGTLDVDLHDLSIDGGIQVDLSGGSDHVISLSHLIVTNGTLPNAQAVRFDTQVSATLDAESNIFHAIHGMATQMYIEASNNTGTAEFRVVGNHLNGHGGDNSFGGIQLILDGPGTARADIFNNSMWDVGGCGCVGGAGVYYRVNDPATDDVNVVGNTFEGAVYGVNIQTISTAGGHYGLDFFNNITSHSVAQGVNIDSFQVPSEFTLRAGNNDYFALGQENNFNGYPSGTGNMSVAPRYVSPSTGAPEAEAHLPADQQGRGLLSWRHRQARCRGQFPPCRADGRHGRLRERRGPAHGDRVRGIARRGQQVRHGRSRHPVRLRRRRLPEREGRQRLRRWRRASDIVVGGTGAIASSAEPAVTRSAGKDGVHGNDYIDGGSGTDDYRADSGDTRVSVEHVGTCP